MSISAIHCPGGPSSHWSENWGRGGSRSKSKKFSPGSGSRYGISRTKTTFFFSPVSLDLVTLVVPYPAKLRPKTLDFAFPDSESQHIARYRGLGLGLGLGFGLGFGLGSTNFFELVTPNPTLSPGHPLCYIKLKKIWQCLSRPDEHFSHTLSRRAIIT